MELLTCQNPLTEVERRNPLRPLLLQQQFLLHQRKPSVLERPKSKTPQSKPKTETQIQNSTKTKTSSSSSTTFPSPPKKTKRSRKPKLETPQSKPKTETQIQNSTKSKTTTMESSFRTITHLWFAASVVHAKSLAGVRRSWEKLGRMSLGTSWYWWWIRRRFRLGLWSSIWVLRQC